MTATASPPTGAPHQVRAPVATPSPLQTVRGNTHIAPRAILRIAMQAVREVPNVQMAEASGLGAVASRIRREPPIAAAAESGGGWASLHLRLVLDWPCPIREVAEQAAQVVARRVHELAGVRIDTVDIEVAGLQAPRSRERRVQ